MDDKIVKIPPQCEICERYCYEIFSKTIGPSPDLKYCFDCWSEWYDGYGGGDTKEGIKNNVLKYIGNFKGSAITEDEYERYVLGNTLEKQVRDIIKSRS